MRKVHDPYRNIETTLTAFAEAEGVKKTAVYHYFWYHKTLEGFRDRPTTGGFVPHTYTLGGVPIRFNDACNAAGVHQAVMSKYRKQGIIACEEIRKLRASEKQNLIKNRLYETDDGDRLTFDQIADRYGATLNSVYMYYRNHGTLKGFSKRGHSRVRPKLYPHSELGISLTRAQWAKRFGATPQAVKEWLRTHNYDMNGFRDRRKFNGKTRTPRTR